MSNRFQNFTDDELRVLEAIFCRVGGRWEGYRGISGNMLDEILIALTSRDIMVENRIPSTVLTGSIRFTD